MDLLKQTRHICNLYDIKPNHDYGQNFLVTKNIYDKIVSLAKLNKEDVVLEVGPGLGFLTAKLAKESKKVFSVEIDDKLVEVLKTGLDSSNISNVEIINENVLDFDPSNLEKEYKIVANLPYNISSVFLRKFLSADNKPKRVVLLLQKEVVERIIEKPGNHSLLSLSVQFYAEAKLEDYVLKNNFYPAPKVDSAILSLDVKNEKELFLSKEKEKLFFRLLKFGFSAKRKKLKKNLAGALKKDVKYIENILQEEKIETELRAQNLSLDEWLKLFARLESDML
ncbi:ribosomal RNA small subunit methyltransferase A [bacterium]|nr:ribosomal RNA small subunit methyltransferase A [bacterium]